MLPSAMACWKSFDASGRPSQAHAIVAGLTTVRWPARLERALAGRGRLLDAAHNPAGARALASYLAKRVDGTRRRRWSSVR